MCTGLRQTYKALFTGLWEFSHSASLEGCFAIQMSHRRDAAERKWKKGTHREDRELKINANRHTGVHMLLVWGDFFNMS